jgi:nitroimidazol reductase NimA-like FMN-containing flavoprotein (pyridoxamine 5'-phosphate oxidase superfamily)
MPEPAPDALSPTPRTTLRRLPERGGYDRAQVEAILDEALICHVGFVVDGQPYVIPTIHARRGDQLYVHGSAASRMLRTLREAVPLCVTVTLLDGLVLARSAFHHSMNYRSVVLLGAAREVAEPGERLQALEAIVEHVVPGRWPEVRPPSEQELKATLVLALPISEASAKVRSGPPKDDAEDLQFPCWAGVLPLRLEPQPPVADPALASSVAVPECVRGYRRPAARG